MEENRRRRVISGLMVAAACVAVPGAASGQADSAAVGVEVNAGYATWWGLWHLGTVEAHGWFPWLPNVTGRVFHGYRPGTNLGCSFDNLDCEPWWSATGIMGGLRWSGGDRVRPFFSLQAGALTFESGAGRVGGPIAGAFAGLEVPVTERLGLYVDGAFLLGGGDIPILSAGAGLTFRLPW